MATPTNTPPLAVGRRIKEFRQSKGLTQKEFAASLGIVQGFLSGIEQEKKSPSDTLLIALCNLYKINEEWLTAGEGEMYRASNRGEETADVSRDREIPLLGQIAPEFPRISKDDVRDYVTLPGVQGNCCAIVAYGDFMAPTIRDGDLVIFRPGEKVDNGDIILIVNHWGETILRRYRQQNGNIFCTPDNTTYAAFTPDPQSRIIGTVTDIWRKVKL
jgi:repressor LexA